MAHTKNTPITCALALLAAAAEVALTEPTALSGYGTSGLQIREKGKDTCVGGRGGGIIFGEGEILDKGE